MKKNYLLFILIILAPVFIQAQEANTNFLPNITPPSPSAFQFVKYGNTPIGMSTGSPNIQIPLFTYKTTNINVPFSLNYSSTGIKVDEVNGRTGLGWNLIGGGMITRIVRNLEDDFIDDFPMKHFDISAINKSNALVNIYFNLYGENFGKDSERDLFVFNFSGHSGKFYIDANNGIVFLEKTDLRIDVINTVGQDIFTFSATTPDGTSYFFNEVEYTSLRTQGGSHAPPTVKATGWYLTKIVHPKEDEVYFNYDDLSKTYIQSESQQASRSFPYNQTCAPGQGYSKPITISGIYSHQTRIIGKILKSITSNNLANGSVTFTTEDIINDLSGEPDDVVKTITVQDKTSNTIEKIDFNYLVTPNRRIFLSGFHFLEDKNSYAFGYVTPENFPQRLSKSQDHWGFFNAANNSSLVPKTVGYGFENYNYTYANKEINQSASQIGLLKKITYPTKGYTEFEYESNTYYGTQTVLPPLLRKTLVLDNNDEERRKEITTTVTGQFAYTAKITGWTGFDNCDSSFDTGGNHHKGHVTVFCVEDNAYVEIFEYSAYGTNLGGTTDLMLTSDAGRPYYFTVQKNKNYIVKLYNYYNCIHSFIAVECYDGNSQIINTNIPTGGSRVKFTKDYPNASASPVVKNYAYSKFDQPSISSGIQFQTPDYINFSNHPDNSDANDSSCTVFDVVVNSSSINSLYEMGSNVYYRYVTVSEGTNFENGYEENEFTINPDYREQIYLGEREFKNVPWSNIGWDNGNLVNTKTFEKQGTAYVLRKEVINNYQKDTNNPTITNYAILNTAPGIFATNTQAQCGCTTSNITEYYTVKYCSVLHIHQKDSNGICIAPGANNLTTNIYHPCYGKTNGQILAIASIAHLNIMPYKYISYFSYLADTTTKEYDKNGLNPYTNKVSYNYSSPNHKQMTSQVSTSSNAETIEKKFFYAKDPEMSSKPFVSQLITANMVGTPLDTQSFKAGTKLSEQLTIYDRSTSTGNLLLPKTVYAAKFPNALPNIAASSIGQLEKKITFDQYDAAGNIIQYTLENGTPVSVIWGYGQTQPIAKIENALYSAVSSYSANLQTKSDSGTEAALITDLNALRAAFPNAMVTTYTYKPLVGISTVTDPKGEKTTYTYDSFNRLETVKDKDGNLLTENQYNYKP
ncbi:RHS repeat domain-containing protein [Flavobacterium sp. H4147]|uniref:RHS repeat domain-containing protein n=1 Tax=Flavobacterium sp. H4147 TaxID=3034149 RepID=UPI0023EDFBC7|nr:RHS repeat domain-containing protein [Flavobacterium sp. H4147]